MPNISCLSLLLLDKKLLRFPYINLCNTWAPVRDHFWPKSYNLNNLDSSSLDEPMCQISKVLAFLFQTRIFLTFFQNKSMLNKWVPGLGHFGTRAMI